MPRGSIGRLRPLRSYSTLSVYYFDKLVLPRLPCECNWTSVGPEARDTDQLRYTLILHACLPIYGNWSFQVMTASRWRLPDPILPWPVWLSSCIYSLTKSSQRKAPVGWSWDACANWNFVNSFEQLSGPLCTLLYYSSKVPRLVGGEGGEGESEAHPAFSTFSNAGDLYVRAR